MLLPPIIHEDDSVLVLDKPCGLPTARDRWEKTRENVMDVVRRQFGPQVANVHRLDADTSGVLLCAKSKPALDFLSGQFQSKSAEKRYVALVVVLPPEQVPTIIPAVRDEHGRLPESFDIDLALGPDETDPARMRAFRRRGGQASFSRFRTLEQFGRFAWVECHPQTGRLHQLRVHLAAAGAPILGDLCYGRPEIKLLLSELKRGYKGREAEKPLINRLALHAQALSVSHPETRQRVTWEAPLPDVFSIALKYLRRFGRPAAAASRGAPGDGQQ